MEPARQRLDYATPSAGTGAGRKAFLYNLFALLCACWFLLTGWMWAFAANLVFAYPVGLAGLLLWWMGRRLGPASRLNKSALIVLVIGLACSLVVLSLLLLYG